MSAAAARARTCTKTGLHLTLVQGTTRLYRIAKSSRGALSVPVRGGTPNSHDWNRFDTPGRTLYLAQTQEIAFAEVLSSFKRALGTRDSLTADAAALGMTLDDFVADIANEWGERHLMSSGCVPAVWRNDRTLYTMRTEPVGWWVDIEHPDSIAALSENLEPLLATAGLTQLTTSNLRSDDRTLTAITSFWIRGQTLDDGSQPVGIRFGSKHGGGSSYAYWMRRTDDGLSNEMVTETGAREIVLNNPALRVVAARFHLHLY